MMEIDETDLEFLRAVSLHGTATTTDIRRETGFSRGTMRYRYGKLEGLNYIETGYADESNGSGAAPRTATLTKAGEQLVRRRGPDDDADSGDETVQERLDEVDEWRDTWAVRLTMTARTQDDLEARVEELERQLAAVLEAQNTE